MSKARGAMRLRDAAVAALPLVFAITSRALAGTLVYAAEPCLQRPTPSASEEALARCHVPIFVIEDGQDSHNRIGRPEARARWSGVRVGVDPDDAVVYVGARADTLGDRPVVHLLYRVHFTKHAFTPRTFFAMHRNAGVLAIVTIDLRTRTSWMLTTVGTCGCYRATIPTDAFPSRALPPDWPQGPQKAWGKSLPARLPAAVPGSSRFAIRLEPRTHRVTDVYTADALPAGEKRALDIAPMTALHTLPVAGRSGETTSFFREKAPFRGHVKGGWSPIEGLTLGLLILDPRIGSDKDYGDPDETGTRFYTMLLPCNREVSRLDRFTPLLRKLGFRLENLGDTASPQSQPGNLTP